ncbi:hypothetical protein BGX28_007943, partial [Mortierella sp. GBA30]
PLTPKMAQELANFYLENARKSHNDIFVKEFCTRAGLALSRITKKETKRLARSPESSDKIVCNGVAAAYRDQEDMWNKLGNVKKAQACLDNAKRWQHPKNKDQVKSSSRFRKILVSIFTCGAKLVTPDPDSPGDERRNLSFAQPDIEAFPHNITIPLTQYRLPLSDERITSTPQLAHCLSLLSETRLSNPKAQAEDPPLTAAQVEWIKAKVNDVDEQERLRSLETRLVEAFNEDGLKDAGTVAEVLHLVPVLDRNRYRQLLSIFIDGIVASLLLNFDLVEGLALMIQNAAPGHLLADDSVKILNVLSTRLQDIHEQSPEHLYRLAMAVSRILDAMADIEVKGLNRETLHAPLSAFLDSLKNNSDPYLVFQAAYAHQALMNVPDDEERWHSLLRRGRVVLGGVASTVSAVRSLDVNGFIEGLGNLHEGLVEIYRVARIGYEAMDSLVKSGNGLRDSLREGFSFSRKRAWYRALRGADALFRGGNFADFKRLVCEAPCRFDLAFQWGLCLQLGEIAADRHWEPSVRRYSVHFLGELYRNDTMWGRHTKIKQLIIHILRQLSDLPNPASADLSYNAMSGATMLLELMGKDGGEEKLYNDCINDTPCSYLLRISVPSPSSKLLDRVQEVKDVEEDLRHLKTRRLAERGTAVYIAPQAKASPLAPDDSLFPLMEKVQEFLNDDNQKVLLLLGDSGSGKSTFIRALECDLWGKYEKSGRIPLHINLPSIDRPEQDLVSKHLRRTDFTEPQIREMKHHRELVLICDGYDESQQSHNLYTSNQLNQPGHWHVKMIISCRSEYLCSNYWYRFQPIDSCHIDASSGLQEAVIVPFSPTQIEEYITRYVSLTQSSWRTKDYKGALEKVPNLMDLVKNPFLLTLSLDVLPRLVDTGQIQELSGAKITRVALYDQFIDLWLHRGKKRLSGQGLRENAKVAFDSLVDEGFAENGVNFLKRLASAIYKEQGGYPVVEYLRFRDEKTWKAAFFSREEDMRLLRDASPLVRCGSQHRFVHRSLLEYCFSLAVFDPQENKTFHLTMTKDRRCSTMSTSSYDDQYLFQDQSLSTQQPILDNPLSWRSLIGEPSIIQFLAERAQQEPLLRHQLLMLIERSKTDRDESHAAANAITILVRAGVSFNGADLTGIQIRGANLSGGEFDSVQLQGADLRRVNLRNIWLRQADLRDAKMPNVNFGEWPFLMQESGVQSCAYSADGNIFVVGHTSGSINMYDTKTWTMAHTLEGHTDCVTSLVFSPCGSLLASGSDDKTVLLWGAKTGISKMTLSGHTGIVTNVVFSPSGVWIASGSNDKTVRVWDSNTGALILTLSGHTNTIVSVAFSPCGSQIASGSYDNTVCLWDMESGTLNLVLEGHEKCVRTVAYSPNGEQVASGSYDNTIRLWNPKTGDLLYSLKGHTDMVMSVVYSPTGHQVASASYDSTVRLWDAKSGTPGPVLEGHTGFVKTVVYAPNGQHIASVGRDKTVRLWDAVTGAPGPVLTGHFNSVMSVVYSPSGLQIATGSLDRTVRLWETQSGAPISRISGHNDRVTTVMYSPSGQQIASGSYDKTIRLWDAQTGMLSLTLIGHESRVESLVYSPTGEQIASASHDRTVRLWDSRTGIEGHILNGHDDCVTSVAYSPDGSMIASASEDRTIRFWDVMTGRQILDLGHQPSSITSVTYSPDGQQIAFGGSDRTVRLWNLQSSGPDRALSGQPGPTIEGHNDMVTSVIYSPCGGQIASASNDNTVRLWDAQTGEPVHILEGHTDRIRSIMYSPKGEQIISGSLDNSVRLWDVSSGVCLTFVEVFHAPVRSVSWNPSGSCFTTGCDDKSVRSWKVTKENDGRYRARLHWTSKHDRLVVSGANFQEVQGLSRIKMKLLEQRGAVGEPLSPPTLRELGRRVINMQSTLNRLRMPSP